EPVGRRLHVALGVELAEFEKPFERAVDVAREEVVLAVGEVEAGVGTGVAEVFERAADAGLDVGDGFAQHRLDVRVGLTALGGHGWWDWGPEGSAPCFAKGVQVRDPSLYPFALTRTRSP